MGNCRYCPAFTQEFCKVCLFYICRPHLPMHYIHPEHKTNAAKKGIQLNDDGSPAIEDRGL